MRAVSRALVALSMLASLSIPAAAQGAPKMDLTGSWAFTVVYEGGSGSPTVTLTQKGDSLTGRYISQVFGELEVKGSVKGQEFSFGFTTAAGGDSFSMTFTGTQENADALKGSVSMGEMGSGTFTAKRNKSP